MSRKPPPVKPTWRPHLLAEDPDTPGVCSTCHFPAANGAHVDPADLPAPDPDQAALTARILGESQED